MFSFLSLLRLRLKTQLSLKKFETICASKQPHFSADAFLIVDTKAFQPGERQLRLIDVEPSHCLNLNAQFYLHNRTDALIACEAGLGTLKIPQGLELRVVLDHRREPVQFLLLVRRRVDDRL